MRRRFREFHEIKEAERPGGGVQQQQQYGQQDDGIDPLELKDTIEDDPDDYYDFEEEEEEVIDPLELKDTIEDDPEDYYEAEEEEEEEITDPLELKDTIEDDPDDYYDFEEEEEEVIDPLELKDTIEDDPDDYYDFEDEEEEEVTDSLELKDTIEEDPNEEIRRYTVSVRVSCSVEREFEVGESPSPGELKPLVSEQMESISTEGIEDPSVVCLDELDIDEDNGFATESYAVNGWVDVDVSGVSAEDAELKAIRFVDSGCFIPNPDIDEVSYDGDTIVRENAPEISKEKRNVIEK